MDLRVRIDRDRHDILHAGRLGRRRGGEERYGERRGEAGELKLRFHHCPPTLFTSTSTRRFSGVRWPSPVCTRGWGSPIPETATVPAGLPAPPIMSAIAGARRDRESTPLHPRHQWDYRM